MNEAMDSIHYFRATEADIKTMANTRIEFLVEFWGPQPTEQVTLLRQQLEKFFSHAIKDELYVCWFAKIENTIAGVGGMSIREQPGTFKNPSGKVAYIMTMYTVPAHRKKGICTALLKKLMTTAKEMGIDAFELHATKEGETVYQKSGFQIHGEPTYRKYGFEG